MKKAVITTGGKQYIVSEGETLDIELLHETSKTVSFDPLMVIDDDNVSVGTPLVETIKVKAEILDSDNQADKVTSIRYKAKKRVHKVRGHRQRQTTIRITQIR